MNRYAYPLFLFVLGASFALSAPAWGAGKDEAALAQKLFEEARAKLQGADFEHACPLFAESQRLDPAVGTLLNLAECYVAARKLASAWATFVEAEARASREGQSARANYARQKASDLRGTLSTVTMVVPPAARMPGLRVQLDGRALDVPALGYALPLDGGRHEIALAAPGYLTYRDTFDIAPASEAVKRELPALKPAPGERRAVEVEPPVSPGLRPIPSMLVVTGGLAIGAGLGLGATAWSRNASAGDHCVAGRCDDRGLELLDGARSFALASTITVLAGVGVAALGIVFQLISPASHKRAGGTPGLVW